MSRLPTPGGDANTWGTLLNEYLLTSLRPNGTLRPNVVGTDQVVDSSITTAKLDASTQAAVTSAVKSVNGKLPNTSGQVTLAPSDVGAATSADLTAEITARTNADALLIPLTQKGTTSGVATLDGTTKIPKAQLPDVSDTYARVSADWTATTSYKSGQLAVANGLLWKAITDHTSGASFDSSNWSVVGSGELFYAENITGSPTGLSTSGTAITGCVGTIPACSRPVWIEGAIQVQIATAGAGSILASVYETTSGSPVYFTGAAFPVSSLAGAGSKYLEVKVHVRIASSVVSARTFALYGTVVQDAGSSLAANARNISSAKSYLTAFTR